MTEPVFTDTLRLIAAIPQEPSVRYRGLLKKTQHVAEVADVMRIDVMNDDCIDTCVRLAKEDPTCRVGLLNMASDRCPGGGVTKGARAQEEDICRRTTLYPTLLQQRYPLAHDEIVYTPNVKIVKCSTYASCEAVNIAGVATAAALRRPALSELGEYFPEDLALLENKITMLLETFEYHGIDHIVLGAWGCGAFRNPPKQVASAFRDALSSARFRGSFKRVTFAIATPWTHDAQNLDAFRHAFFV